MVNNLHLESKGTEQLRLEQLDEVLAEVQRDRPETPIIIAGDLSTLVFRSRRTHVMLGELDWVFLRGSIECADEPVLHVPGSDHFPISVDLRLYSPPRV